MPRASKRVTERPRIYGDEKKCRAAVARYIAGGQELLDQTVGVRNRIAQAKAKAKKQGKPRPKAPPTSNAPFRLVLRPLEQSDLEDLVASDWIKGVESWHERAVPPMRRYLQEQFNDVLPTLAAGPARPTESRRRRFSLDNAEPWLREAVAELRQMQSALGVQRAIAIAPPPSTRFAELHRSGLVDEKVIKDHAKAMSASRTPKQLADAIGSAKEITEATLRGALDQIDETYKPDDDLRALMRKWRATVGKLAPPDSRGAETLDKALAALANLVTFLAEWRNKYGSGHGRKNYPHGLTARHARLAADAAETCVRFIVMTMDDLELLPP